VFLSYVKTYKRENIGYDFGAWSDLLLKQGYAHKPYDYYIFANSSIIGPYMNDYPNKRWTDVFTEGITDDIKLFGITINTDTQYQKGDPQKDAHVQSFLYAMRQQTVHELIQDGLFSTTYVKTFDEAVLKEIGLFRLVIKRGGNIGSLMSYYKGIDWRSVPSTPAKPYLGDVMYPQHKNSTWSLNELVFIKGNRGL
jgi:lipopolysaccharide biosynthesis protein